MVVKSGKANLYLRRAIRALAAVEAIDAVLYLRLAGWFSANPFLVLLTVLGVAGAALVWLSRRTFTLAFGALLVAAAPSVLYPLSALLVLCAVPIVVMAAVGHRRRSVFVAAN